MVKIKMSTEFQLTAQTDISRERKTNCRTQIKAKWKVFLHNKGVEKFIIVKIPRGVESQMFCALRMIQQWDGSVVWFGRDFCGHTRLLKNPWREWLTGIRSPLHPGWKLVNKEIVNPFHQFSMMISQTILLFLTPHLGSPAETLEMGKKVTKGQNQLNLIWKITLKNCQGALLKDSLSEFVSDNGFLNHKESIYGVFQGVWF